VLRYTLYPLTVEVLAFQVSETVCVCACTPVPVKLMAEGDPVALLVTVTDPVKLPAVVGSNVTLKVRLCVGASVTGTLAPLRLYAEPLRLICEICTLAFPVLVTVTFCEADAPVFTLPKFKAVELIESVAVETTPVPVSATAAGEFGALLTTEMLPEALPAALGEYCTLKFEDCPGFSESGSATAEVLKPLPETLTCVIVNAPVPLLVS